MNDFKSTKPSLDAVRKYPKTQKNIISPQPKESYCPSPAPIPIHRHSKNILGRCAAWISLLVFLGMLFYAIFFLYQTYILSQKINPQKTASASFLQTLQSFSSPTSIHIKGDDDQKINILLLGMAGKGKPGQNLTDTIMIASLDMENNRVALFSIPRDLYVSIPNTTLKTKINSVYQYGLSSNDNNPAEAAGILKETVSEITGFSIDHYVILNFEGFEKIIDHLGGINISNERDIFDDRYPGPNYSYETFALSQGFHTLNGASALKYARVRHNDPEGDFGRAKRQQQIMQSAKNKLFSTHTLVNVFALNEIFQTLGENIQTDIALEEFPSFLDLLKKLDTRNMNNVVIDAWNKDSLLKVSHVQYGTVRAFILVPRVGNYTEIKELAKNIFDLNQIKRKRESVSKEDARLAIINRSGNKHIIANIKNTLQENLNYKNVQIIEDSSKKIKEKTILYDLLSGEKPFTLDELSSKLPADISYEIPPDEKISSLLPEQSTEIDMLLFIGTNLIEKYSMEESTLYELNAAQDDQMYLNLLDK